MLTGILQPNLPKAALGLDKDSITTVALQREGRGQFGVKQAATIELPENLLTPGFLEQNISSPSQFRVFLEEAVAASGLLDQKKWSVSLPSSTARTAILSLDAEPASKQESEEILDWKAEQTFGAPAAELRISRQKVSPDRTGKPRYFATAVKLSVIDEYETVFESFGWKAGLILPRVVSEAKWLTNGPNGSDSLLISSQPDGFTALLLRGSEPAVVRSVTCTENERDDEIYRLLMFYNDRLADERIGGNILDKLLIIGKHINPSKIRDISAEAFGRALRILRPDEIGLNLPASSLSFDDIAAPAGLAAMGWK